jgi:hypothetical protein
MERPSGIMWGNIMYGQLLNCLHYLHSIWSPISDIGTIGEFLGGTIGLIISFITLLLVLLTYFWTKKNDSRNALVAMLVEILKTQDGFITDKEFLPQKFLKEFGAIYKTTKTVVSDYAIWSVDDRIDIAFTFMLYGPNSDSDKYLSKYGTDNIKIVHDKICAMRDNSKLKGKLLFQGNQKVLGHYYRNLFNAYVILEDSGLPNKEKLAWGKIVKTKLSNYDQALLALDVVSHFGAEWTEKGFVSKYKPISNIPEHFFGIDQNISLKKMFPSVLFEFERYKKP